MLAEYKSANVFRHLVDQLKLREVDQARTGGSQLDPAGHVRSVVGDDQAVEDLRHLLRLLAGLLPTPPLLVDHAQGSGLLRLMGESVEALAETSQAHLHLLQLQGGGLLLACQPALQVLNNAREP